MEKFEMIRRIKLQLSGVKITKMEEGDGPCWPDYEQIGTKILDGKTVPNCVPIKASKVKEGFPIPSPESSEDEQAYISRCISNIIDEYGQEQSAAICYNRWQNQ
jgi:hypothetical protein